MRIGRCHCCFIIAAAGRLLVSSRLRDGSGRDVQPGHDHHAHDACMRRIRTMHAKTSLHFRTQVTARSSNPSALLSRDTCTSHLLHRSPRADVTCPIRAHVQYDSRQAVFQNRLLGQTVAVPFGLLADWILPAATFGRQEGGMNDQTGQTGTELPEARARALERPLACTCTEACGWRSRLMRFPDTC